MKSPLASSPAEWLNEIKLAIEDAKEAKPFGRILGVLITDFDLFQLAPLVCLQFRGRKQKAAFSFSYVRAACQPANRRLTGH